MRAAEIAATRVAAARDDPAQRLELASGHFECGLSPEASWKDFAPLGADLPSSASWYRAHNSSIIAAYLEHESLATRELLAERFVINLALVRVLCPCARRGTQACPRPPRTAREAVR